jgi:hypothetical protein
MFCIFSSDFTEILNFPVVTEATVTNGISLMLQNEFSLRSIIETHLHKQ